MKALINKTVISILSLSPVLLRRHLFYLLCQAVVKSDSSIEILKELFGLSDILQSAIDQQSILYEGEIHPKHRLTRYHAFFCDRITSGERVIDIGCGYGSLAASIAKVGAAVTAVDLKESNIELAKKLYGTIGIDFQVADATQDLPNEKYQVVVLSNVLEHIEDRESFLGNIKNSLNPDRWLIRVPRFDRDWKVPLRKELGISYYSDPTHYTEYTLDAFRAEMDAIGLITKSMELSWGEIWAELIDDG